MPAIKLNNNAFSTLAAGLTNVATTLTVATGHGDRFPVISGGDWAKVTLQDAANNIEIIKVTARAAGADSMTIERAQEGTTARAWAIGDVVEMRFTAGMVTLNDAVQTLTNKTINLTSNTLVMTMAQLNAAISDGDIPDASTLVSTSGDQTISGAKSFSGTVAVGGGSAPATSLDVQTTGANVLTSAFTTGLSDLNFRLGAMNGVAGGTVGTTQGKLGLFYLGTGEVATIDFRRGATATDGSFAFRTAGVDRATLDNSGNFVATGNVTAYSDIRLKTGLVRIPEALAKVKALAGYTFTRLDTQERQTGLLAQDVQRVMPEAVIEGEKYLSVAYGNLVGLLVEAIKELEERVKELEKS